MAQNQVPTSGRWGAGSTGAHSDAGHLGQIGSGPPDLYLQVAITLVDMVLGLTKVEGGFLKGKIKEKKRHEKGCKKKNHRRWLSAKRHDTLISPNSDLKKRVLL